MSVTRSVPASTFENQLPLFRMGKVGATLPSNAALPALSPALFGCLFDRRLLI